MEINTPEINLIPQPTQPRRFDVTLNVASTWTLRFMSDSLKDVLESIRIWDGERRSTDKTLYEQRYTDPTQMGDGTWITEVTQLRYHTTEVLAHDKVMAEGIAIEGYAKSSQFFKVIGVVSTVAKD